MQKILFCLIVLGIAIAAFGFSGATFLSKVSAVDSFYVGVSGLFIFLVALLVWMVVGFRKTYSGEKKRTQEPNN